MTKFVAYYRVSTDRQGRSGLGLEAQREAVRQYLADRGWPPIAEFTEVESGRKSSRPKLTEALAACRLHKAKLVIAKLDRLTRNVGFLVSLRDSGVDFIACDMPDANKLTINIIAAVAEDEAERISARTKAALAAKVARDGQWDRKAKHHLVPGAGQQQATAALQERAKARAADYAQEIARLRATGLSSLRAIAEALNEQGIPTTRGGRWQAVQVKRVLDRVAA
ncbi:recombinase family protein [Ferrovibrio sp.]|uniref:recombinase family protein n=1 Tax=Ferrovibrio sp. TaxID=1917215 RepID=UPI00260E43D6|nr:recombinase family protein [Ferrovibrio sp.]